MPIAEKAGFPVLDGLIQRVEIIIGFAWVALTALQLWREARKARLEEASTRITVTEANAG